MWLCLVCKHWCTAFMITKKEVSSRILIQNNLHHHTNSTVAFYIKRGIWDIVDRQTCLQINYLSIIKHHVWVTLSFSPFDQSVRYMHFVIFVIMSLFSYKLSLPSFWRLFFIPFPRPESLPKAAQSNDVGKSKGKRYGMIEMNFRVKSSAR